LLGLLAVAFALHAYGLSVNVTESMPLGLYHVERLRPPVARGTIVQACLPTAIAAVGRARGYLLAGSCSDGSAPVLKIVAARAGDRVEVLDRQIRVNGAPLPGSATAASDSRGRQLAHVARGTYLLARDQLWFWTPNPVSWDSRYYGPVADRQVLGRATLLLPIGVWRFADIRRF
jgi:conjugative transfer signal peptidase TraF